MKPPQRARDSLYAHGEASHPGPLPSSLVVGTCNVTSIMANEAAVLGLPGHVWLPQEVRLDEAGQRAMRSTLRRAGWQAFWGAPQPRRRKSNTRPGRDGPVSPGGVGVIVRDGIPAKMAPLVTQRQRDLWATGRWVRVGVACGDGRSCLNVHCIYGHTWCEGSTEAWEANEDLLDQVFEEAEASGAAPAVVGGDLNTQPEASNAVQAILATGRWRDLALAAAVAAGREPRATCYANPSAMGRRLDCLFGNAAAAGTLRACDAVTDQAFPTHLPLRADLAIHAFGGAILKACPSKSFVQRLREAEDWPPEAQQACAVEHFRRRSEEAGRARADGDVDRLWELWSEAAERYLVERCGGDPGDAAQWKAYLGRHAPRFRRSAAVPRTDKVSMDVEDVQQVRLGRLSRRLEAIDRARRRAAREGNDRIAR